MARVAELFEEVLRTGVVLDLHPAPTELADAVAVFGSATDALADFVATRATGFAAGDGCVATAGAEFTVETFAATVAAAGAAAPDVLEAMGVVAGGGGIGATV